MSDTNTKTGNNPNTSFLTDILNNNSFSRMMYSGPGGIPYAAIGMISIAAGVFSYVTYVDYKNESEAEAAKLAEAEQSDGMFASIFGENKNADAETMGTDENQQSAETLGTDENQQSAETLGTDENQQSVETMGTDENQQSAETMGTDENQQSAETMGTTENKTSVEPGEEFKLGGRNKKRKSKRKSVRFAKNSKKTRTRGKSTQN